MPKGRTAHRHSETDRLWNWPRLLIGFVEMGLVGMALGSWFASGLTLTTYCLAAAATCAAIVSRIMYRGRSKAADRNGIAKIMPDGPQPGNRGVPHQRP